MQKKIEEIMKRFYPRSPLMFDNALEDIQQILDTEMVKFAEWMISESTKEGGLKYKGSSELLHLYKQSIPTGGA